MFIPLYQHLVMQGAVIGDMHMLKDRTSQYHLPVSEVPCFALQGVG